MDYSIRIPATEERKQILEENAKVTKELTKIKDYVFKPVGVLLSEFHPEAVCVRLREFVNEERQSTLDKIDTIKTETGYTDTKESLGIGTLAEMLAKAQELGYEKWGEIDTHSIEYDLEISKVLLQELSPIGILLKIESETQEGLNKTLQLLKANESERIDKNAAVLLGEHLKLILR